MRREHSSILIDVLDQLAACVEASPSGVHITQVAARANLPHDRLKEYVAELVEAGLLHAQWPPAPTQKGLQFLQCYHAWIRIQRMFGLHPKGAQADPVAPLGKPPMVTVGPPSGNWMASAPASTPGSSAAGARDAHNSLVRRAADEPLVRGP